MIGFRATDWGPGTCCSQGFSVSFFSFLQLPYFNRFHFKIIESCRHYLPTSPGSTAAHWVSVGGKSGDRQQRRDFKGLPGSLLLLKQLVLVSSLPSSGVALRNSSSGLSSTINKTINDYVVIRGRSIRRNWVPSCQVTFFMNQNSCNSWQSFMWLESFFNLPHTPKRKEILWA